MDITELCQSMERIAENLITTPYITDFTVHDTDFIHRTNAKAPFVWLVYYSGTHIYDLTDSKDIRNFIETLDYFENYSNNDFCLYRYDSEKLFPVFPKVMHEWIENKLKEYSH